MRSWLTRLVLALMAASVLAVPAAAASQGGPDPAGVILVKGAWASAAGSASPLPEDGKIVGSRYANAYFGFEYAFGIDWIERFEGPPPSDNGYYVLAQIEPKKPSPDPSMARVLIAAQDLFFTAAPVRSAFELLRYRQEHLGAEYQVEHSLRMVRIANRDFARFDYLAPQAGLHWHVLATEIRCHVVEFIFTGSDARSLEKLTGNMKATIEPMGNAPVCLKGFADSDTVLTREDPVLSQPRFNPVPVRIVIDKEGKVSQIHFLSAFPEQARNIADALLQWRFKPYLVNGEPVEVETGLTFGRSPQANNGALH
ncbi:MAG TPA: hypothetical protein VHS76_05455 [Steroidobacteraceae bacterium]|jgi:hypothetical protein|nr:hypothetical protein [Steroidobacteraceae bacterium]